MQKPDAAVFMIESQARVRHIEPFDVGRRGNDVAGLEAAVDGVNFVLGDMKHFEAGQIPFQPKGEAGRKLISDILDMQRQSETALVRREELLTLIPQEFKREKFERTGELLEEFKATSPAGLFATVRGL